MIKCPYHLKRIKPKLEYKSNTAPYVCPECGVEIPRDFVEKKDIPRATVGLVGFPGHGKTVYITSLFYLLKYLRNQWDDYFLLSLDDNTHSILHHHVPLFESSELPDATPSNFPSPSLIYFHNIPMFGDGFLCFYDTSGEVFEDTRRIPYHGKFVAHSDSVLFNVSLNDCGKNWSDKMIELLNIYINAVYNRMHVNIKKKQHLIVVLTKSDSLTNSDSLVSLSEDLIDELKNGGTYKNYLFNSESRNMFSRLKERSEAIKFWLLQKGCQAFVNIASQYFSTVEYTMVSSTGSPPVGRKLAARLMPEDPKMILDPFLWVLEKNRSVSIWKKLFG
ncbi:MAG: hypothetical protein GY795_20515 [Desulfobacterales bacterium]|nr:hypothetical protein [Desulfobacterales bacterium]